MFFLGDLKNKKTEMPRPDQALPGRDTADPDRVETFRLEAGLKGPYPEGLETAMFGLGCFWGAERLFWQTKGVWVTAVGYAGGITPNPTYQETCTGLTGHAEVVLVVFDPKIVSYADLLKIFWESHDPTQGMRQGNDVGTTYRSAIYTFGETQQQAALASARRVRGIASRRRPRRDHDRDRAGADLLFRRGRAPAVPRQEPLRLLRPAGHRRRLRHSAARRPGDNTRGITVTPGSAAVGRRCAPVLSPNRFFRKVKIPREFCLAPCKIGP